MRDVHGLSASTPHVAPPAPLQRLRVASAWTLIAVTLSLLVALPFASGLVGATLVTGMSISTVATVPRCDISTASQDPGDCLTPSLGVVSGNLALLSRRGTIASPVGQWDVDRAPYHGLGSGVMFDEAQLLPSRLASSTPSTQTTTGRRCECA